MESIAFAMERSLFLFSNKTLRKRSQCFAAAPPVRALRIHMIDCRNRSNANGPLQFNGIARKAPCASATGAKQSWLIHWRVQSVMQRDADTHCKVMQTLQSNAEQLQSNADALHSLNASTWRQNRKEAGCQKAAHWPDRCVHLSASTNRNFFVG